MALTKASATRSGCRMKRSAASVRPVRQDGRQHDKTDGAETVPRSTPDQAATHVEHVPLTTAQAAIFRSPDLWAARCNLETRLKQLQNVQCALTSIIADSSQPLSVNGLTVEVQKQNLTEVYAASRDVCAIVHPTNPWLGTQGGVSTAIAAAVGHHLFQEACSHLIDCNSGSIGWGEAKITSFPITSTNHLHSQYVIHAVLPLYSGDAAQDEASMQSMVQAVLDVAAQTGVTTLAMPLLGAGLAQWPLVPTAKAHVAKVLAAAYCSPRGTRLKKVIFADLSDEAVAALRSELAKQAPQFSLTLSGTRTGCQAAAQHLGRTLEARKQKVRVDAFFDLSDAEQEVVLQMPVMEYLTMDDNQQGFLHLQGDTQLVSKVQFRIEALLAAKVPYVVNCPANSFPCHWAPQHSNTELFEVDLKSPEVAEVIATLRRQCSSVQVVKVHRIQNKKLWKHFAFHYSNMQERWSHEPGLNLVNGGRPQLWHGTSATEPQRVYATEQGFAFNFARKDSIWGSGTYYSCSPSLAINYCHVLQPSDTAFSNHLAGMQDLSDLKQIMAVDVLTGKSKLLVADNTICTPPKIEDESIGIQLGISELRYDSVEAMHPDRYTPIYITYNSGHGYPKYLITYTT